MPQKIRIRIAGRDYEMNANSPKDEELKRKAAAEINRRLEKRLKMNIRGVDMVDHLSLTALELGTRCLYALDEIEKSQEESRQLHRDIESYLENTDK